MGLCMDLSCMVGAITMLATIISTAGGNALQSVSSSVVSSSAAPQAIIFPVERQIDDLFNLAIAIGTPPQPLRVAIDTGSTITFVACEGTESAAFNRSLSTTAVPVPCDDPLCRSSCSDSGGCCDAAQHCRFTVSYEEGSRVQGTLFRDLIHLLECNGMTLDTVPVVLGCAEAEDGPIASTEEDGILGLRLGSTALLPQLQPASPTWGFCLGRQGQGALTMGPLLRQGLPVDTRAKIQASTPGSLAFHVTGFRMGKDRAWDTDGTDQMVAEVDTGYTAPGLLPAPVHEAMLVGLWEQLPQSVLEKETTRYIDSFELRCWMVPTSDANQISLEGFPDMFVSVVVGDGEDAVLTLNPVNYLLRAADDDTVWCFSFTPGNEMLLSSRNLLDMFIEFTNDSITFTHAECSKDGPFIPTASRANGEVIALAVVLSSTGAAGGVYAWRRKLCCKKGDKKAKGAGPDGYTYGALSKADAASDAGDERRSSVESSFHPHYESGDSFGEGLTDFGRGGIPAVAQYTASVSNHSITGRHVGTGHHTSRLATVSWAGDLEMGLPAPDSGTKGKR